MYRDIIVPLDGSEMAEQAVPVAAGIARRSGADLCLMHALDYLHTDFAHCPPNDEWWTETTYDNARRYLQNTAASMEAQWGVYPEIALEEGDAQHILTHSPRARRADLLIMTTHGRGRLERFRLGSVADQVLRVSPHDVLLVPVRQDREPPTTAERFEHILVPLDGSELGEQILHRVARLAIPEAARVTIVRVVRTSLVPVLSFGEPDPDEVDHAARYVQDLCHELHWMAHDVDGAVLTGASPVADQILQFAADRAVDMIAVKSRATRLGRFLLGGVADKLIRESGVPVLVAPAPHKMEGTNESV